MIMLNVVDLMIVMKMMTRWCISKVWIYLHLVMLEWHIQVAITMNLIPRMTRCATCVLDIDCLFSLWLCEQFICLFVVDVSFVKCYFMVIVDINCRIIRCRVCVLNVWITWSLNTQIDVYVVLYRVLYNDIMKFQQKMQQIYVNLLSRFNWVVLVQSDLMVNWVNRSNPVSNGPTVVEPSTCLTDLFNHRIYSLNIDARSYSTLFSKTLCFTPYSRILKLKSWLQCNT